MLKKTLALLCAMLLLCTCALADTSWTCPGCGKTGLTTRFCGDCGTACPLWTCPGCGTAGLSSAFCPNCGTRRPGGSVTPVITAQPIVTAAPVLTSTPRPITVRTGDIVRFGSYNGTIEWKVLEVQAGKALLLSRYGLECASFNPHSTYTGNQGSYYTTWSNSALRTWLNGTFLNKAFSMAEREAIQQTYVDESEMQTHPKHKANRIGESTYDKVFLLSYAEMAYYLPTNASRMCAPTAHARQQGCYISSDNCFYWLRTPAYNNNIIIVETDGTFDTCYMHHSYGVVRPAIWVDASALH